MQVLDVGCGPGTITADLATLVPGGHVIGLEYAPDVLVQARATAEARKIGNIDFQVGDIHALKFPDNTFDVVHAHQVLQHVSDPILALTEMRRVTKPGGIVAVRECDYSSSIVYPDSPEVTKFVSDMYVRVAKSIGGEPNAGRMLHSWAKKVGFERSHIMSTTSTWCYNAPEDIQWWGDLWADRILSSSFAKNALGSRVATIEELNSASLAWKEWMKEEDAWFNMVHGEIICRV